MKRKFNRVRRAIALTAAVAALGAGIGVANALPIGVNTNPGHPVHGVSGIGPQDYVLWLHDDMRNGTPNQGWDDASINFALNSLKDDGIDLSTATNNSEGDIRTTCQGAIADAKARGNHQHGRVVGLFLALSHLPTNWALWGANKTEFRNKFVEEWDSYPNKGGSNGALREWQDSDVSQARARGLQGIDAARNATDMRVVCLAVNEDEPSTPPQPPTKSIQQGVSADSMTNVTTIRQGTGHGGRNMTITDHITPNGVNYSVSNIHIVDTSANNQNVDNQFRLNWDRNANTVSAVRTATGTMPADHYYQLTFDVTVHRPSDFHDITDYAETTWNNRSVGRTDEHRFDTWEPTPDKSWVLKGDDDKWQAVIDPDRTNNTGADNHKFLDGDEVGSVVNATMGAHLIQAPTTFRISDDWTAASYVFKPGDKNGIRVYEKDASTDRRSSVADIVNTGTDVTDQFDITLDESGHTATASMKSSALSGLRNLSSPRQYTLLVPGKIALANGEGAAKARQDAGKNPGDEMTLCKVPTPDDSGNDLTNSAAETVNSQTAETNVPKICVYVPPVKKDVVSEASQGGDQESVDGKAVYPGQKVEYQLLTQPNLPSDLSYTVKRVAWTDKYDQYLKPDKQTLEMIDLATGRSIPKTRYTTRWNDADHTFTLNVTDAGLISQWRAGSNPRLQVRFEGTVAKDAPTTHRVNNEWTLTLNNSLTPSNEVYNVPPDYIPHKKDVSNVDPAVSIDGKKLLLGDKGEYRITLDAHQSDTAYKVYKLGIVDDFDDEYLTVRQRDIRILDPTGVDVTGRFNVQIKDGVLYAFAKTVDTLIPATGETVSGDPQPSDLKAYSTKSYDPLHDPAIDQSLLGKEYTVVMPYTVSKVKDGYVVKNKATQIANNTSKETEEVSNPLVPVNPSKDVVVNVGSASAYGKDIYLNHYFLYRLQSSKRPSDLAYPQVSDWHITDKLDPSVDRYTGQWAVYADTDLTASDGTVIARKGAKIAGSNFTPTPQIRAVLTGGDTQLFTVGQTSDGTVTVAATGSYKALVSDGRQGAGWSAYIQVQRLKVVAHHDNQFTETINGTDRPSNVVWTRTPDQTPSIAVEKYDVASGLQQGDRDRSSEALSDAKDGTRIGFKITNTGKAPLTKITLDDKTIKGAGKVENIDLTPLRNLTLQPGQSVTVYGTLKGVPAGGIHTDRGHTTGVPLLPCAADQPDIDQTGNDSDQPRLCESTPVQASDDWNGKRAAGLAQTGSAVAAIAAGGIMVLLTGAGLMIARRRGMTAPQHKA